MTNTDATTTKSSTIEANENQMSPQVHWVSGAQDFGKEGDCTDSE